MNKVQWFAEHFEEVLGAFLLSAMACLAFANVLTRYVFHYPLAFTEELEVNSLVWLTMLGTSAAFRKGCHLRMVFVYSKFSLLWQKIIDQFISLLSFGLFSALGVLGYRQLIDERFLEITSESLNFPQWIYTICIPVGCILILIRIVQASVLSWKGEPQ